MKFMNFVYENTAKIGVVAQDENLISFDEMGLNYRDLSDFIINKSDDDMDKICEFLQKNGTIDMTKITPKAPIIMPRQDIICLGINYMDHAKESYKFKNIKF